MALPQLTDEQRKAALEKAAAARHARAELREKIKKGETTLKDVLESDGRRSWTRRSPASAARAGRPRPPPSTRPWATP